MSSPHSRRPQSASSIVDDATAVSARPQSHASFAQTIASPSTANPFECCLTLIIFVGLVLPLILLTSVVCFIPFLAMCVLGLCYRLEHGSSTGMEVEGTTILTDLALMRVLDEFQDQRQQQHSPQPTREELAERIVLKQVVVVPGEEVSDKDGGCDVDMESGASEPTHKENAVSSSLAPTVSCSTLPMCPLSQSSCIACEICLEPFQTNDIVGMSRACLHMFHKDCILEWLCKQKTTCPCCRGRFMNIDDGHKDDTTSSNTSEEISERPTVPPQRLLTVDRLSPIEEGLVHSPEDDEPEGTSQEIVMSNEDDLEEDSQHQTRRDRPNSDSDFVEGADA